jgi:hypothetical protein
MHVKSLTTYTVSNCAYAVRLETAPTGPGGNAVRFGVSH